MSGLLEIVPLDLASANEFVRMRHRHHKPVIGHKFSLGAVLGGKIIGVAIVGRPVACGWDDGCTLEVSRRQPTEHETPAQCSTAQLRARLLLSVIGASAPTSSQVSRAPRW